MEESRFRINLQRFAGPDDEVNDLTEEDLREVFGDVEDTDEFGNPIPAEADIDPDKQEEPAKEQEPVKQEEPAKEQEPAPEKKTQTPEENARFAEMRRQKQEQERIERDTVSRLQQTPEYQMAKLLADQYGMPVDQLLAKMQEAMLKRQAEEQKVPVEVLKEIQAEKQARQELETRLNKSEFNEWYRGKQTEAAAVKQQYPFLTDEDINGAIAYQLETLRNTQMPLEQAVMTVHGTKITAKLREIAKQEALAEISGRKQGPLAPQGSKQAPSTATLTDEERYVAKKMGMTEEDYLKYRT